MTVVALVPGSGSSPGGAAASVATGAPTDLIVFSSGRASDAGEIYELAVGAPVRDISRSPYEEGSLTAASDDSTAFISNRGRALLVVTEPGGERPRILLSATSLRGAQISPDGSSVAAWADRGAGSIVTVVGVASGARTRFATSCVGDLSWSPDATRLLCVTPSDRVLVLDPQGRRLQELPGIDAEWVAPHGLALIRKAFRTRLLDSSGRLVATLPGNPAAVSRDGHFIALTKGGSLAIADSRTGRIQRRLTGPHSWEPDGTFTPDGRELAYLTPQMSFRAISVSGTGRSRRLPADGVWSSDGGSYAFLRIDSSHWRAHVLVGDRYGEHPRLVGTFPWDDHGGDTLVPAAHAFFLQTSLRPHADLWSIRPDGSGLRRLTRGGNATNPAWSPNGHRLAYAESSFSGGLCGYCSPHVVIATPSGKRIAILPSDEEDANPVWSRDGRRLAVEHGLDGEIDIVDADGNNRRPIVSEGGFAPTWSPDGKTLAYTSYSGGDGIHLISASGQADRLAVPNATSPAWSPSGDSFAFVRSGVIFLAPAAGASHARRLTVGDEPAFAPSGTMIAFSRRHGIFLIRPDGTGIRELTTFDERAPAWRPRP